MCKTVYVASRASIPERSAMWRELRDSGWPIVSSWIDEAGKGESLNLSDLWLRIECEIRLSDGLVLYAEPDDFPLKGALVEVGIALAYNKRIIVVSPDIKIQPVNYRPFGSWLCHPDVSVEWTVQEAFVSLGVALGEKCA